MVRSHASYIYQNAFTGEQACTSARIVFRYIRTSGLPELFCVFEWHRNGKIEVISTINAGQK